MTTKTKAQWAEFQYVKESTGEVNWYRGEINPLQTNATHIGLILDRQSPTLAAAKAAGTYEQARKANGQFKREYRRFIRANILNIKTLNED